MGSIHGFEKRGRVRARHTSPSPGTLSRRAGLTPSRRRFWPRFPGPTSAIRYPISIRRDLYIKGKTVRINYDQSLAPTLLLHLGAGVQRYLNPDATPASIASFDEAGLLGIKGAPGTGYPRIGGGKLGDSTYGGMANQIGPTNRGLYLQVKPTAVSQITWIRGNHTYKAGGEWKIDTFTNKSDIGLSPSFTFSTAQTSQPLYGTTLPGGTAIGSGFASFLLGYYNAAAISNSSDPQYRKSSWGFFIQDTWKLNRKLTLDYGLRYDLQLELRDAGVVGNGSSSCERRTVAELSVPVVITPANGLATRSFSAFPGKGIACSRRYESRKLIRDLKACERKARRALEEVNGSAALTGPR